MNCMKFLTDRQEIAKAMNFGKYPVLYIDRDNKKYDSPEHPSDFCIGSKCRLDWEHKDPRYADMTARCELYYSNGRYHLSQGAGCLHADFGRHDVLEMVEWARVPLVRCGQTVIVVEDFTKQKLCKVRVMKIADRKDLNCSTVTSLEDIEEGEEG